MMLIEAKIVILGSQGVGKTSIVARYIGKMFTSQVSPTIGASFFTCIVNMGETRVKMQVWDTAGQERFRSMAPMYYRNANAALLIFDITNSSSFQSVKTWVRELQSNVREPMVMSVVGNKVDLEEERQVSAQEGQQYAHSIGAQYYEASALQNQGVEQVFLNTASGLMKMAGQSMSSSLRQYDSMEYGYLTPAADCSLHATSTGITETPPWSIDSIAHGDSERSYMCC